MAISPPATDPQNVSSSEIAAAVRSDASPLSAGSEAPSS